MVRMKLKKEEECASGMAGAKVNDAAVKDAQNRAQKGEVCKRKFKRWSSEGCTKQSSERRSVHEAWSKAKRQQ